MPMHTVRRRLAVLILTIVATTTGPLAAGTGAHAGPRPPASLVDWGPTHVIVNYHSNKCLQPNSYSANALVVQYTCGTTNLQKWRIVLQANGYAWLQNVGSRMCMDLKANSEAEVVNGTLVQVFHCSTTYTTEQWNRSTGSRLQYFQTWNRVKGLCLDVQDGSSANNARLQVWSCKYHETAQQFRYIDA